MGFSKSQPNSKFPSCLWVGGYTQKNNLTHNWLIFFGKFCFIECFCSLVQTHTHKEEEEEEEDKEDKEDKEEETEDEDEDNTNFFT